MSDVGVSTLLLAVVAMLVAIIIGGLAIEVSDDLGSTVVDTSETRGEEISTDFQIISPSELDISDDELTIHTKNTGKTDIQIGRVTVLLDGEIISNNNIQETVREGSPNIWDESETLTLDINLGDSQIESSDLCDTENQIELTANSKSDSLTFFASC